MRSRLRILFLVALASTAAASLPARFVRAAPPAVEAVGAIGVTVGDLDRAVAFYRDVLSFTVESEHEASGPALEHLEGVFGAHVRSARLRLGDEAVVLTQYLAPRGRPVPAGARSNDRAFQHVAIVVADTGSRRAREIRSGGARARRSRASSSSASTTPPSAWPTSPTARSAPGARRWCAIPTATRSCSRSNRRGLAA